MTTKRNRRYTEEEKIDAVRIAIKYNSIYKAANVLDISRGSLDAWHKAYSPRLVKLAAADAQVSTDYASSVDTMIVTKEKQFITRAFVVKNTTLDRLLDLIQVSTSLRDVVEALRLLSEITKTELDEDGVTKEGNNVYNKIMNMQLNISTK